MQDDRHAGECEWDWKRAAAFRCRSTGGREKKEREKRGDEVDSFLKRPPDRRTIATGHSDGSIHLWDLSTRKQLGLTLKATSATSSDLIGTPVIQFSADGHARLGEPRRRR
jgi:WD40 repeat protein